MLHKYFFTKFLFFVAFKKNANFCIYVCCVLSCSVVSDPLIPDGLQPTRLLYPQGFSRQEYWSGLPFPLPWDLPNPGIEPRSPTLQADFFLPSEPPGTLVFIFTCIYMHVCVCMYIDVYIGIFKSCKSVSI